MSELGMLRWRCRRGMKELDVALQGYLEKHYAAASAAEQRTFAELVELQDPQLYAYLLGREVPSNPVVATVIDKIRAAPCP